MAINYEKNQKKIEEIVEKLEQNEIPLEENMELVEKGLKLVNECKEYLDNAELKIKKIVDGKTTDF